MTDQTASLVITGVRLFDGERTTADATVHVDRGLITSVGTGTGTATGTAVPRGVPTIDGRGCTLLPGLVDAHTHAVPGSLGQALRLGVTTEIDMFNDPAVAAGLRAEAAVRADVADIRSAGTGATVPAGHPIPFTVDTGVMPAFPTVTGPQDAERFVAGRVDDGSDHLKIFVEPGGLLGPSMPVPDPPTVAALAAHAHDRDLLAVAHCTDRGSARYAVDAGVDGLVHVFVDGDPGSDADAELAGTLRDRGTFVVPTLVMLEGLMGLSAADELLTDDRIAPFVGDADRATLGLAARSGSDEARAAFDRVLATVAALRENGITLLAGSDAINPGTAHGASIHRELELLVRAGLTPAEALRAATATPARCFGLTDRGRIAPGMVADLLLVRGDPTVDVRAARDVVDVWRRGVRLRRDPVHPPAG